MADSEIESGALAREFERALEEHRECMRRVAELESCLGERADSELRSLGELRGCLAAVSETFRAHFASEQQGPLFREFPATFPQFSFRLGKLATEHATLLAEAAELEARVEQLREAHAREMRSIEARVRLLVARLRRHEAEEDEILLSAYWDDAGLGD